MSDIYGMPIRDLPDTVVATDAFVIVKALGPDGSYQMLVSHTEGLTDWEAVGMLTCVLDTQRAFVQETFYDESDDEEDE